MAEGEFFFLGQDDSRVQIIIVIIFFRGGGGMASSAKVTFIPVIHEPGQPGAAILV